MGGSTSIPKRISCTHLLERASRLLVTDNDEQPYLIIEEGTCYVDTNVYWLQLWLTVERGVDQYEDGSFDPGGLLAWQTARRLLDDLKVDNL